MRKVKVKIREVIEHTYYIEEFNEHMAKQKAREKLRIEQKDRIWSNTNDVVTEELDFLPPSQTREPKE